VARAKRTDRAEARRRYRAFLQQMQEEEGEADDVEPAQEARTRQNRPSEPVIKPGEKVGFVQAFRLATRQPTYISDLRWAPTLIMRTYAVWPVSMLSVAGLIFGLTRSDYNDGVVSFLMGFAFYPPMIQPMAAGFLAPRATWLAGLLSSLVSGICFLILVIWYFGPVKHLANTPASAPSIASGQYLSLVVEIVGGSMAIGLLLGAASGWYKRFLNYLGAGNQRNAARTGQKPAQKPTSKRSAARR
jgi:hypothetical protein